MSTKRPKELTPRLLLDFYDACLRGSTPSQIAANMALDWQTLKAWMDYWPDFAMTYNLAMERKKSRHTLAGYVFGRLSQEARDAWERIQFWDGHVSAAEKIEDILSGHPTSLRQELFIHALVMGGFDVSSACRLVNVNLGLISDWKRNDPHFRQLVEEIQFHKKNFFEHALIGLVNGGNANAIMFVNRTVNADRGYSERMKVEHTTTVENLSIDIDQLDLDVDTRRKILDAVRRKKEAAARVDDTARQLTYADSE